MLEQSDCNAKLWPSSLLPHSDNLASGWFMPISTILSDLASSLKCTAPPWLTTSTNCQSLFPLRYIQHFHFTPGFIAVVWQKKKMCPWKPTLLTKKSIFMAQLRNKEELVDSTINISGMDITVIMWYNTTCVYAFL